MMALILEAKSTLLLSSFALMASAEHIVASLATRSKEGVRITLCLDDGVRNVEHIRTLWPTEAPPPRLMVPDRSRWPAGSLHAKVLIADGCRALVTSANLTGWATDSNLEVGVLVDGAVSRELNDLFLELMRSKLLVEQPFQKAGTYRPRGRALGTS